MKFDCGPTRQEKMRARCERATAKRNARRTWHKWFAWFPVQLGSHDCRWLEYVQRRECATFWHPLFCDTRWEYEELP